MIASTLAVFAALTLAADPPGDLKLSNVRATHGLLGPKRTEKQVLPGDRVFVCFDIDGITVNADGKVQYSIATDVTDAKGKSIYKQEPRDLEVPLSLGGNSVPGYSQIDCGLEQPAGKYTLKLTVVRSLRRQEDGDVHARFRDRRAAASVWCGFCDDARPRGALPVERRGQSAKHAYGCNSASSASSATRLANSQTSPSNCKSSTTTTSRSASRRPARISKDVPDNVTMLPIQFLLSLNRAGKFSLVVTATDQLSRKTTKTTLPLTVLEAK